MGRYKKGQKQARKDVWAQAGGIERIVKEMLTSEILKYSQKYGSPIWSQLSTALFGEDSEKNRHWLWVIWSYNRKGVRDQLNRAVASRKLSSTSKQKLLEESYGKFCPQH